MIEAVSWPEPHIVEAPLLEERERSDGSQGLIGLHLTTPEAMGRTLIACGVDPTDVPNWTVYVNNAEHQELGNKEVALDVMAISEQMDKLSHKKKLKYNGVFKKVISTAVMNSVYHQVTNESAEVPDNTKQALNLVEFAGFSALYTMIYEHGFHIKAETAAVFAMLVSAWLVYPEGRLSKRASARKPDLFASDIGLQNELTNTILPIYFSEDTATRA